MVDCSEGGVRPRRCLSLVSDGKYADFQIGEFHIDEIG